MKIVYGEKHCDDGGGVGGGGGCGGGGGGDSINSNRMKNLRLNNSLRPFHTRVILPGIQKSTAYQLHAIVNWYSVAVLSKCVKYTK